MNEPHNSPTPKVPPAAGGVPGARSRLRRKAAAPLTRLAPAGCLSGSSAPSVAREGFLARTAHGRSEKALNVRSIGAVQIKPANALMNGRIQFSVSGESSKKSIGFGRSQDAAKDENAVIFTKAQSDALKAIADAIRAAQAAPAGAAAAAAPDVAEQIRKLDELHGQGILSDEEYGKKKADLLERM